MGFGRSRLDWFGALLARKQWEPYGCYGHNGLWLGEVAQRRSKSENRRLIQFESTRDPLEILPCILSVVANIATQSFTKSLRQCFNQSKTDVSQQDFLQPVHFLWFLSTKKKTQLFETIFGLSFSLCNLDWNLTKTAIGESSIQYMSTQVCCL